MPDDADGSSDRGPIDTELLDRIATHLTRSARFTSIETRPTYAPTAVIAAYDLGYFPNGVTRASLHIRWFETDDFSIHYSEQYQTGTAGDCRWDCHPNDHTTREHFHPLPDASTPNEDTTYSTDWRDVLTTVLTRLDDRIEAFWNQ